MSRISTLSVAVGLGLVVLILAASGVANAQYFFRFDVLPSTTVGCNADSVDLGTSTASWNLPPAPNNAVFLGIVNGVRAPDYPDIQTITPNPGSETSTGSLNPLGSPSVPYTAVVQGFPAINGSPVGTGIEIRVQCNTLGPAAGVATFSVVQAPVAPPAPDLNQHGLTGSWYEAATSGQGVEIEVFPNSSSGTGSIFVSWFTYDTVIGGAERQRWYTAQGPVGTGGDHTALAIYRNTGGNFNAPPVTTAQQVGGALLAFDTCSSGELAYSFDDGTGRSGHLSLTRLTQNVTCTTTTARPTNADFALSGNWYDPATSGQGLSVEVNPISGAFFAAWYTYAPNGAGAGVAGQRWYTAQAAFTPGLRSMPVTIYETTGGVFDKPTPPGQKTVPVGTGTMAFQSCSAATFSYNFTGGSSSGASGTIALRRVGPLPPGCTT